MNHSQLSPVFLIIAISAIFTNVLLIVLGLRVPRRPNEIKLAIVLSLVDMCMPSFAIITILYNAVSESNLGATHAACQIKGPIDYIGMYISMFMVAIVAYTRISRLFNYKVNWAVWVFLGVFSVFYFYLVIVVAVRSEYNVLPNGIDCAPDTSKNIYTMGLTISFGVGLIMFLFITLICYLSLLFKVLPGEDNTAIPLQDRNDPISVKRHNLPQSRRTKVILRTSLICLTYFLLIVPACILLIFEAQLISEESTVISTAIDVCLNSVALANPLLVIFAHSLIYHELTQLFNSCSSLEIE